MGLFQKISEGLRKTRSGMMNSIHSMLHAFGKIDEELFEELEELLIMGDVGVNTAEKICEELRARVKKENIRDPQQINELLRDTISEMLGEPEPLKLGTRPSVILVALTKPTMTMR